MSIESISKIINEIADFINRKYDEYRELIQKVNKLWEEYKRTVIEIKKNWDKDSIIIRSRIEQLKDEIQVIKELLDLIKTKRELELIDENYTSSTTTVFNELLSKINSMYDELKIKFDEIDSQIKEHWIRSVDILTLTQEKIDEMIKELENIKSRGELSEEVYSRIVKELEILRRVTQALTLLRSS